METRTERRYFPTTEEVLEITGTTSAKDAAEVLGLKTRQTIYDWSKKGIFEKKLESYIGAKFFDFNSSIKDWKYELVDFVFPTIEDLKLLLEVESTVALKVAFNCNHSLFKYWRESGKEESNFEMELKEALARKELLEAHMTNWIVINVNFDEDVDINKMHSAYLKYTNKLKTIDSLGKKEFKRIVESCKI